EERMGPVARRQLPEQAPDVALDRELRELLHGRDLLVRQTVRDQLEHAPLRRRDPRRLGLLGDVVDEREAAAAPVLGVALDAPCVHGVAAENLPALGGIHVLAIGRSAGDGQGPPDSSSPATEAPRRGLARRNAPEGLARTLIDELVAGDSRLRWHGGTVALAAPSLDPPLGEAELVVLDLETTGLAAASARICEIGAVRIERLELVDTFQTLVAPGVPLPRPVSVLTGPRDEQLGR